MNASDPCVIIIDERALISTVLKQLCEAIKPGLKVYHFAEPGRKLSGRGKVMAVLFDVSKFGEVSEAINLYLPGEAPVMVGCGSYTLSRHAKIDYSIDLYESPQKIIEVLKDVLLGTDAAAVISNQAYQTSSPTGPALYKVKRFAETNHRALTPRQIEVLEYAALGLSAPEIADELNVSVNTVRGYVQEIFVRLNVRNIAHAVSFYLKMQTLIDFEDTTEPG